MAMATVGELENLGKDDIEVIKFSQLEAFVYYL